MFGSMVFNILAEKGVPKRTGPLDVVAHDLFLETFAEATKNKPDLRETLNNKLRHVVAVKSENPLAKIGKNDTSLHGNLSKFSHLHLTRQPDLVLIYYIQGNDIHFVAISRHEEYDSSGGKRKSLEKRLQNA